MEPEAKQHKRNAAGGLWDLGAELGITLLKLLELVWKPSTSSSQSGRSNRSDKDVVFP